jgi:addiction module HigA family antidote
MITVRMTPTPPGEFLREEVLAPLGLNVTAAAQALDVGRVTLSRVLNGHAALSPEMALRIEKAFGVDMEMLLGMQMRHDIHAIQAKAASIKVARYRKAAPRTKPARN